MTHYEAESEVVLNVTGAVPVLFIHS